MLDMAKQKLLQVIKVLQFDIRQGVPVVGLEPSCVSVFRDELGDILPDNEDAKRLREQVFTLSEFMERHASSFPIPVLKAKAIVHGHCHQKAIIKMDADKILLEKMGVDFDVLDAGCCGLAGYFGYKKGVYYDVSIKAGERVLLPAVRNASPETFVIADGFSCREQIEQQSSRKTFHLAEMLRLALHMND
jgi:Fe-S oxidoreductase